MRNSLIAERKQKLKSISNLIHRFKEHKKKSIKITGGSQDSYEIENSHVMNTKYTLFSCGSRRVT